MSYVPLVLGIKPYYGSASCTDIEVIYKSGNLRMRLEGIPEKKAKHRLERHGIQWAAHLWRPMDRLSDWEPVKEVPHVR